MSFAKLKFFQYIFAFLAAMNSSSTDAADSSRMELSQAVHNKITALSRNGDVLAKQGKHREAVQTYRKALELVPKPISDWQASTWLLVAIGDAQFLARNYEESKGALVEAMKCPGAIGNPFIHMRLGQVQFELGNMSSAADELARAYIPEGKAIFANEDRKYLAFIKSKLQPPPGGWPEGW